jgi:hypothetical protein
LCGTPPFRFHYRDCATPIKGGKKKTNCLIHLWCTINQLIAIATRRVNI